MMVPALVASWRVVRLHCQVPPHKHRFPTRALEDVKPSQPLKRDWSSKKTGIKWLKSQVVRWLFEQKSDASEFRYYYWHMSVPVGGSLKTMHWAMFGRRGGDGEWRQLWCLWKKSSTAISNGLYRVTWGLFFELLKFPWQSLLTPTTSRISIVSFWLENRPVEFGDKRRPLLTMRGRFTQALQRTPSVRSDLKKLAGFVYQTSDDSVRIAKREEPLENQIESTLCKIETAQSR